MTITASLVSELRQKTGVGLMECKKVLVETNGNLTIPKHCQLGHGRRLGLLWTSRLLILQA